MVDQGLAGYEGLQNVLLQLSEVDDGCSLTGKVAARQWMARRTGRVHREGQRKVAASVDQVKEVASGRAKWRENVGICTSMSIIVYKSSNLYNLV